MGGQVYWTIMPGKVPDAYGIFALIMPSHPFTREETLSRSFDFHQVTSRNPRRNPAHVFPMYFQFISIGGVGLPNRWVRSCGAACTHTTHPTHGAHVPKYKLTNTMHNHTQ
jgi:hypothetical protein